MLMISSSPPHSSSLWLPSDCSWKQTHNDITHTCRHADRPTLELWWPASTPAPHLTERWSEEPHYLWTELLTECALLFLDNETISHWFMGHGHRALRCSHWLDVRRLSDLLMFRHEAITSMEKSACEWRFRKREKQTDLHFPLELQQMG